jgi:ParB family transcriptional regulator, chromosome partitioning protein
MERRSGLGRGLAALLPTEAPGTPASGDGPALRDIPVSSIEPNPFQPRRHFDEEAIIELSASIREVGVLQPILVRPLDAGRYQLIAGERRWRAARRANLDLIPAVVRATADLASVEQALIENIHRSDLSALEEAAAFQLTHDDVAKRVSKSRVAVTNTLRLLHLPAGIHALLIDGRLSAGHGRALLSVADRQMQETLAHEAVREGWSVRALEDRVRQPESAAEERPASPAVKLLREPGLLELEQLLGEYLSTRVHVTMGPKRGKMVIEFADLEDLERLYRRMTEINAEQ